MPSIEQLQGLLQKEPEDAFLNFGLAMAFRKDGQDEAALSQFDRTIEVDPAYVAAYFHKGQLFAELDRPAEARAILQLGIEKAGEIGDEHARGEMGEFLAGIG